MRTPAAKDAMESAPLPDFRFTAESLGTAGIERAIMRALHRALEQFSGRLLDIGCGEMPYRPALLKTPGRVIEYVGMDLQDSGYGAPDVIWDGHTIPFEPGRFDCALITEVLEHCPDPELVLREAARVLVPGGFIFFTVPFLWPLHCSPHDEYRYTPFALERHFRNSGFVDVAIESLGSWDASLATMIGLWVNRRPMNRWMRKLLAALSLPLVKYLWHHDRPEDAHRDQVMHAGFSGWARSRPA